VISLQKSLLLAPVMMVATGVPLIATVADVELVLPLASVMVHVIVDVPELKLPVAFTPEPLLLVAPVTW
jgi:hypothetical protein